MVIKGKMRISEEEYWRMEHGSWFSNCTRTVGPVIIVALGRLNVNLTPHRLSLIFLFIFLLSPLLPVGGEYPSQSPHPFDSTVSVFSVDIGTVSSLSPSTSLIVSPSPTLSPGTSPSPSLSPSTCPCPRHSICPIPCPSPSLSPRPSISPGPSTCPCPSPNPNPSPSISPNSHSSPTEGSVIIKKSGDPMWVHRLVFASLNGLLFLLGLANVLVLFIVSRYRRMRTVTNILIFNLCLADLIYISFLPVVIMFQLLRDWMFGIVACKLFYITESTAKYASVYFVGVLSLDRYFALCHPQVCKRYRKPNLALLVSAIGWCVTATLMTPIYLYSTVIGIEGERFCTVAWPNAADTGFPMPFEHDPIDCNQTTQHELGMSSEEGCVEKEYENISIYNTSALHPPYFPPFQAPSTQFYFITLTFVFCFGIPALVILFFYFKVLDQLFQASSRAERLKKRREKTYRKVTRMVLAVISFYLICWLPYWIQFLVVTFAAFSLNNALKIVFNTIHLLPYLNCSINPILYSLMTDNTRRILAELFPLSRLFSCCSRGQPRANTAGQEGQGAVALLERASRAGRWKKTSTRKGDELDEEVQAVNGESSRFPSLTATISPSIRMISELSINMLTVRRSRDQTGSTSATSISAM